MIPVKTPQCNFTLSKPKDWDEEKNGLCASLSIMTQDDNFISFWKPTDLELEQLIDGGFVAIKVFGTYHPAIALGVAVEEEEENATS